MLKATGRATGSSQCRYVALSSWSLSRPYNEWMLEGAQGRSGNNRYRKAHKLALLVSWVCIQKSRNTDNTKHTRLNTAARTKELRSCTDAPIKYKPKIKLI